MSLVIELSGLIRQAQQELNDQIVILAEYLQELDTLSIVLREALEGSARDEERRMREQLAYTQKQMEDTTMQLRLAYDMLGRLSDML